MFRPRTAVSAFWGLPLLLLVGSASALSQPANGRPQPVPSSVSLAVKDAPLKQVLADVTRQTHIAVDDQLGDPDPTLTLDRKRAPFWQTLDAIAEKAGARVTLLPRDARLALARRGADEPPPIVSYSGPFRLCVKGVTASRHLDTGAHPYVASVELGWEPGVQALYLESRPHHVVAVDDTGRRHAVPDEGSNVVPVDGRISLLIDVPLPTLPRSVTTLTRLDGRLTAVTPSKMLRFAFPSLDQIGKAEVDGPQRRLAQDGVTCRITKLVRNRDRWVVQVTIDNPSGGTILESYQPWDANNQLVLESKDGKERLAANSYVRESETSRHAVLSYHFTDRARLARLNPEDWSPVYTTPALVVTVPLAFSFKDVPLP